MSACSGRTWIRLCLAAAVLLCGAFHLADARRRGVSLQGEPGQFDYYLLTLSWSPTYCLIHPDDHSECARKGYGFVLHGLWPQFDAGGYPENCSLDTRLSRAAEEVGRGVYPSPTLMHHEWRRHGTCSGLDAVDYFRTADRALASVRIPSNLAAPATTVTMRSAQIAAEFRAVNAGMPQNALTVACSRGELSEVRLCLSRDLQPRSCGRGVRSSCPSSPIEVPAAR